MSDDDEALRLNTLNRFRKQSQRLLLEEYSHCEVPAGCGGVVLRWVDPGTALPVLVRVYSPSGESSIFVDGRELEDARIDLEPGPHVLVVAVRGGGPLLLTALRSLGRDRDWGEDVPVLLRSAPTAAWKLSETEPPAECYAPDFDASGWATPGDGSAQLEPLRAKNRWAIERHEELGATALALPPGRSWVRVRFEIAPLDPGEVRD